MLKIEYDDKFFVIKNQQVVAAKKEIDTYEFLLRRIPFNFYVYLLGIAFVNTHLFKFTLTILSYYKTTKQINLEFIVKTLWFMVSVTTIFGLTYCAYLLFEKICEYRYRSLSKEQINTELHSVLNNLDTKISTKRIVCYSSKYKIILFLNRIYVHRLKPIANPTEEIKELSYDIKILSIVSTALFILGLYFFKILMPFALLCIILALGFTLLVIINVKIYLRLKRPKHHETDVALNNIIRDVQTALNNLN